MTTSRPPYPDAHGFLSERSVVRWGIIGCGDVTEIKSGPAFNKANHSQLVAVMRRDAAKAADYARRHHVPRWYNTVDDLLRDTEVDAVYIATPPDAHLSCALQVAAAGKPAYLEKPMARNTAECDAILSAFAARQLPLFVAYYRRRLPRFLLVQDALTRGAIGAVTGITYCQTAPFHRRDSAWRTDVTRAGAGHLLDLGSHTVDLIDFLFGPIEEVTGLAANVASPYLAEDVATMSFRAGGIPGTATWNFASDVAGEALSIYGTAGRITFALFENAPVVIETAEGTQRLECPHPENVQLPLIQSVVDDLRGVGLCPSTGTTARRASVVLDRVLDAYYGGRSDPFWTRPDTWPGRRR